MKRNKRLVRYNPGSAIGSPAWMSWDEADALLVRDTAWLKRMIDCGAKVAPITWPSITE